MKLSDKLTLCLKHRQRLKQILLDPSHVEDIDAGRLRESGVEAVILDHDGVLGANFSLLPDTAGNELIEKLLNEYPSGNVFILSNTKRMRESRERAYTKNFPDVKYLLAKRKPSQEGLLMASSLCGVPKENIAVLDDGIMTGILMALEGKSIPLFVKRKKLDETFRLKAVRLSTTLPQEFFVSLACKL